MSDGVIKETKCTRCVLSPVCAKKDTYAKMQEAVDKAMSYFAQDFIKPVEVVCKYYKKKPDVTDRNVN